MRNKKSRGARPSADHYLSSDQIMQARTQADIIRGDQKTLDKFSESSKNSSNEERRPKNNTIVKITCKKYALGGEQIVVTENPDLNSDQVVDLPKQEYVEAEIVNVVLGTREELQDVDEDDLPDWASLDDQLIQLELEHEYEGNTVSEIISMKYYENPDPRSNYGQFLSEYGSPKAGTTVTLDYDSNSDCEIEIAE